MDSENTDVPDGPRENLIATAVKFLQNPKVSQSLPSQKRAFLEKKGLTKEEVDIAFSQAGVSENVGPQVSGPVSIATTGQIQPHQHPVPVSTWTKFRDYSATAIVAGGFLYGIYVIYKKYLMPIWYGPSQEERQLQTIQKGIADLQKNIQETLKSIREMQGTVSSQQRQIENMSPTGSSYKNAQEERLVNEVKDEIKSLKGLLLSRKQFPPPPNTQPVLPAWQLAASTKPEKDDSSETNTTSIDTPDKEAPTETVSTINPSTDTISTVETQTGNVGVEAASDATEATSVDGTVSETTDSDFVLAQAGEDDAVQNLLNGHLTNGDLDTGDNMEGQSVNNSSSSKSAAVAAVTKAEVLQPSPEAIAT